MLTILFRKIAYMKANNLTMGERIKIALDAVGLDAASAAPLLGCSREAILQWLDNSTKNIKNTYLWKLEDLTGYNARWITIGDDPPKKLERYGDPKIEEIVGVMEPMAEIQKDMLIEIGKTLRGPANEKDG